MMSEKPPVCNYEGSDYQTSFWEEGGRAYEDACEAVALRRLLPDKGRLMLELGAGAGRNTKRYEGFDRLSYSIIRDRSSYKPETAPGKQSGKRIDFVAADVYKLPFVNGIV